MAENMIMSYREKGDKWVEQAEKAQRRVYMDTLVRCKYYDASHYLELAAQCYRIAKRFHDAGMAYKRCGHLEEKLNKPDVAASFYREAAMCLLKEDLQAAVECFSNAISLLCQIRRFSTAARLQIEVAEIMAKTRSPPLAIAGYIKAADFYRANSCYDKASDRCLLKAANELGLCERYLEAADLFDEIGRRSALDELIKFSSPDLFLKATLCRLCACGKTEAKTIIRRKGHSEVDLPSLPRASSVKAKIVALGKTNTVFRTSNAFAFAMDVTNARIEGDLNIFAARVFAYNNIFCLDSWFLRILKTLAEYIEVTSAKMMKLHAKQQEKARQRQIMQEHAGMSRRPKKDLQGASSAKGAPTESSSVLDSDFIGTKGELKEASNSTLSSSSSSSSSSDSSSSSSSSTDSSRSTSSDEASSSSESSSGTSLSRSQSGSESSEESGSERVDSSSKAEGSESEIPRRSMASE